MLACELLFRKGPIHYSAEFFSSFESYFGCKLLLNELHVKSLVELLKTPEVSPFVKVTLSSLC